MFDKRDRGIYIEIFQKEINNILYTKKETTTVNDNNKIINFVKEYSPPIKLGLENNDWKQSKQ